MALSTSSAASARGQMEKEASLNVRGWIREADYASEVRARRKWKEKKKKREIEEEQELICLNVGMNGF